MSLTQTVPDIAERIRKLYFGLKDNDSIEDVVKTINDILILSDNVPLSLLEASWDYLAQKEEAKL